MASFITIALFSVMCLMLIQSTVYSKPAPQQNNQPPPPPTTTPSAVTPKVDASAAPPAPPADNPPAVVPTTGKVADPEGTTAKVPEAGTPSAQAGGEKKDDKDGSATVYANLGLLVIATSVLLRL